MVQEVEEEPVYYNFSFTNTQIQHTHVARTLAHTPNNTSRRKAPCTMHQTPCTQAPEEAPTHARAAAVFSYGRLKSRKTHEKPIFLDFSRSPSPRELLTPTYNSVLRRAVPAIISESAATALFPLHPTSNRSQRTPSNLGHTWVSLRTNS